MHIKLPYSEQSGHIPSADRLKVGELWINGADNIIGTKKQNEQVVQFAQLTPEQRERVLNDYIPKHGVVDKVSVGQTATKIEGKNDAVTIDINDDSDTAIEYTVTNSALTINIEKTTGHKATKLVISKPASQPVVITWNGVDHWLSTAGVPTFGESLELEELCVAIFTSSTINCVNVIYNTEAVGSTDDEAVWGMIGGSLSDQEDLQAALNSKLSVNVAAETYLKKTDKAESAKVADTVVGKNVTGVVAEATKATQDALGRVINTTYAEANATTATLATKVDKTQYNADKQTFALEETVTAELAKKVNQSAYDADKKTFATKSELATVKNESVPNTATNGSFDSVVDNTASADVSQFNARTTSSVASSGIQTSATSTNAQFTIAAEQSASKMKAGGVAGIRFIGDLDAGVTIEQSSLAKPFVIRNDAGDITLTDKGGSLTLTQLQQLNKNALLKNDAAALYSTKTETSKAVGDLRTQVASTYQTKAEATTTKNQLTTSISTKADKTYVDNTLKSYATTKYVDEKVSTVYRYKGNVANKGSLPADNNVIGDVWNAEDTGKNYVWTGSEWDDIGGVVDLTPYLTKSDATATYLGKTAKAVSATTADKAAILSTARTIAIGGAVTGTATSFNGTANITINTTAVNGAKVTGTVPAATKATQDGTGKVIATTYATKTEVTQGLAGKANISHTHTVSQITDMPKVVLSVNDITPDDSGNVKVGALPLGHLFAWPFQTPPDGAIQCNGATYNRALYKDFFAYATSKGWVKTEAEWQEIAERDNGFCPFYSEGDGSTTFRTPKFAPYQQIAIASGNVGKYHDPGLPNIKGSLNPIGQEENSALPTGAFSKASGKCMTGSSYFDGKGVYEFNASRYNSIFGNSNTVQPESHEWMICVVVAGQATNLGSVDVSNVMSAVAQVQADVESIQANMPSRSSVYVKEVWKSGTEWCRIFSDGWIEQGGILKRNSGTVSFHKGFSNTDYTFLHTPNLSGMSGQWFAWGVSSKTTASIKISMVGGANTAPSSMCWVAYGY